MNAIICHLSQVVYFAVLWTQRKRTESSVSKFFIHVTRNAKFYDILRANNVALI